MSAKRQQTFAGRRMFTVLAATAGPLTVAPLGLGVLAMLLSGGTETHNAGCRPTGVATSGQIADIPSDYLRRYQQAAQTFRIPWTVLAGVGKAESDHGRGTGPGIRSGANSAGAMGPMQFLGGTWRAYGVDGNSDGRRNVYDPADAIPAAARLLTANGAPQHMRRGIFAYNHADWYVEKVLVFARQYGIHARQPSMQPLECASTGNGVRNDKIAKVLAYARRQLGKPYVWGAEGPDSFDCSGLTLRAYQTVGIRLPRVTYDQWRRGTRIRLGQEQPGDLAFFHNDAQGPGHVGIVIGAGKMINARCTACRPGVAIGTYRRPDLVGFVRLIHGTTTTSAVETGTFNASYFWDDGSGLNGDTGMPASGKRMQCGLFASPMWPLGTRVKVTDTSSGRSAIGFIGDFGPGIPAERSYRPILLDLDACTFAKLTGAAWSADRPWYINDGAGQIKIKYQVLSWGNGPSFKGRPRHWRP